MKSKSELVEYIRSGDACLIEDPNTKLLHSFPSFIDRRIHSRLYYRLVDYWKQHPEFSIPRFMYFIQMSPPYLQEISPQLEDEEIENIYLLTRPLHRTQIKLAKKLTSAFDLMKLGFYKHKIIKVSLGE